ncbi:hypothetical protein BH10ACI1_BH10ACI1_07410 [soil metagenome]
MKIGKIAKIYLLLICLGVFAVQTFAQDTPNFEDYLKQRLASSKRANQTTSKGIELSSICDVDNDSVAKRVFADYGAMFVAALVNPGVKFPSKCIFDSKEAEYYQSTASPTTVTVGRVQITLQKPAMEALLEAIKEAQQRNLSITPRGGSEAASRSYADTERLWNSRFLPALNYYVRRGDIRREDADVVKKMQMSDQVAQVLEWEKKRLWFSTDRTKSILYSVAAPGTSQHIFMLALDVAEFSNKAVREILAKHGWFQTVQSDLPHFTYLGGAKREDLNSYGLVRKVVSGQEFWIPNL